MPLTEAQKRANERYRKAHVQQRAVRFYPKDADILAWAMEQDTFAGYVKRLIREDMERRRGK